MDYKGIPTYIVDNHDHAMFFWHQHINQDHFSASSFKRFVVLHIDQHSDIKEVTHGEYNVGNFITHALSSRLIDECIQVRTETALHSIQKLDFADYNYILDIDVDFRERKTDKEIEADTEIVRKLMQDSCLITIATSPYFLDHDKAIKIVKRLLSF
jgi:arginase family enzyme